MVERRFNQKVVQLQTDRGGEFMGNLLKNWLEQKGIIHRRTNPFSPAENGVAERRGGWVQNIMRTLLAQSGLSHMYWGEAILTATFLSNRVYSTAIDDIPYHLLYGKQPDLSYLRVFGSRAWVHVPRQTRRKGAPRAQKLTFVGYESFTKGYRFLSQDKRSIVISRSARFCEHEMWPRNQTEVYLPGLGESSQENRQVLLDQHRQPPAAESERKEVKEHITLTPQVPSRLPDAVKQEIEIPSEHSISQRRVLPERSTRGVPPQRFTVGEAIAYNVQAEPQTYEDVLDLPAHEQSKWFMAMEQEMAAMKRLGVFSLCPRPSEKNVIGCRWVFRKKPQENNKEPVYRARLVAKGFTQEKYTDYEETFSPTVAARAIRVVLTLAACYNWKIYHFDVQTAFLHGQLSETLYMEQAPGFVRAESQPLVYKLHKSIYGLKQASRQWHLCLDKTLKDMGFEPSKAEPCVYVKGSGNNQVIIVSYVDDILITCLDLKQLKATARMLEKAFVMRDLGQVQNYLGIEVKTIPNKGFLLSQTQKLSQVLQKWGMAESKPVKTPMVMGNQGVEGQEPDKPCDAQCYKSLLGSLQHIALWTRPDISNAVNILSRCAGKPSQRNWLDLKRIVRYLKGTQNMCLTIIPEGPPCLQCFVDSDWAGSPDRKSTSGIAIKLAGVLVDWRTKKQSYLAVSTCEAEFAALSCLCVDLIWYKQFFIDLNIKNTDAFPVYEDNMACIQLALSDKVHTRSKHVDIRYQNVRTAVQEGLIKLNYCPSEENVADVLTKPLTAQKFTEGVRLLGLVTDTETNVCVE